MQRRVSAIEKGRQKAGGDAKPGLLGCSVAVKSWKGVYSSNSSPGRASCGVADGKHSEQESEWAELALEPCNRAAAERSTDQEDKSGCSHHAISSCIPHR